MNEQIAALLSVSFAIPMCAIYVYGVLTHKTKPHIFTWVIWSLLMFIGAAAQYAGNAGWGAFATAFGGFTNLIVVCLAFHYGEKTITKSDWATFGAALCIIPLWYFTKNPLYAAVLVTLIDGLGYYPTFRKSYYKPYEENLPSFALAVLYSLMALFAIEVFSLTTALYPAFIMIANFMVVFMLLVRRRMTKSTL